MKNLFVFFVVGFLSSCVEEGVHNSEFDNNSTDASWGWVDGGGLDDTGYPEAFEVGDVAIGRWRPPRPPLVFSSFVDVLDAKNDGDDQRDACEGDADGGDCGNNDEDFFIIHGRHLDGDPCDDGDECTIGDSWVAGICSQGLPLICDDGDACTADSCNPATGCAYKTISRCGESPAKCTAGDCNDGNPCTSDACDPVTGCTHDTAGVYSPCEDGNICTTGDTCYDDVCLPGPPVVCDDGVWCTTDTCNPILGCTHKAPSLMCDTSGKPCLVGEPDPLDSGCDCVYVSLNCDDNDVDTLDACEPGVGCVYTPSCTEEGTLCATDSDCCGVTPYCFLKRCQPCTDIFLLDGTEQGCLSGENCVAVPPFEVTPLTLGCVKQ